MGQFNTAVKEIMYGIGSIWGYSFGGGKGYEWVKLEMLGNLGLL